MGRLQNESPTLWKDILSIGQRPVTSSGDLENRCGDDSYSGGGTYFPRWNLTITGQEPGSMVMYPGGLSHLHAGKKITSAERYVLLGDITGED